MLRLSSQPTDVALLVKNTGFANRCILCGSCFDEGGICNYGHQQDQTYYLPLRKMKSGELVIAECALP